LYGELIPELVLPIWFSWWRVVAYKEATGGTWRRN